MQYFFRFYINSELTSLDLISENNDFDTVLDKITKVTF